MENKVMVGVDIGGTTVKLAFIDINANLIKNWEIKTRLEDGGNHVPEDIWNSVKEKMELCNIDFSQLVGIGVGAPGFVDPGTGIVTQAVNIGWKDFDLKGKLSSLSGLEVYVDNDANIAALGENWKGSGNLADNLIAITLGTGVGAGVIVGGEIVSGVNGTAGEIGHMTVEIGGAPCNCGRNGCLETVASATGIARQATKIAELYPNTELAKRIKLNGVLTSKDVFDAAREGDKQAQELISKVTDTLGLAIANTATVINPSKVVIGGGVSKAGSDLLQPLQAAFQKYALPRISEACEFVIATLGNDAGVFGGAYLVVQNTQK